MNELRLEIVFTNPLQIVPALPASGRQSITVSYGAFSITSEGDHIMSDGWELKAFKKNPIALFSHRSDFPIGTWSNIRVEDKQLRGHLNLAQRGTSERINEIISLVEQGVLRAVSVGFKPLEIKDREGSEWGYEYVRSELVETSLVAVPANPNALAVAKSMNISPETIDLVFAGQGNRDGIRRRGFNGGKAKSHTSERSRGMSSLAQRIMGNSVHYCGDVVMCDGGTWQAKRDTARAPPHEDWACLAQAGRNAVSPKIKGTYREDQAYTYLDIVALNGSSFIAKCDEPGMCPGEGWQVIASAGKQGKPGVKGDKGDRGDHGHHGVTTIETRAFKGWIIDRERYIVTPILADGSKGEPLNLHSLFEQYDNDRS